jgi:pyruvate ferredoxin oxidoreductase beta subunit
MALNLKELAKQESKFTSGHRLCTGCGPAIIARWTMMAADKYNIAMSSATCCVEISSVVFPYSSWKVSWYHNAFENAAAVAGGIEATYKALKRKGKISSDKEYKFIAIGGDGGTADIGFQSLSGMAERGHNVLYILYDNNAYMNTGIQRSGATPKYAWTTTSYVGDAYKGKQQNRKDMTSIMAAHDIPYVAQASLGYWRDYMTKVQKALEVDGPSFINVYAPCWRGWRTEASDTVELGRLAVQTNFWPLYEVVDGNWKITYQPREKKPLADFLKPQGRFSHLFQPGNEPLLEDFQSEVDFKWDQLQRRIAASV